ncbi:MAG: cupin [Streptosporangiales bacterium]|nr:cupin [Streptosporangiales bacterium]
MEIIDRTTRRVTETPNAVMTTLASPTLGGATRSLWYVEMRPDAVGPTHAFDSEVVWSITEGAGLARYDGRETDLGAGDTVVLPAGKMRQFVGGPSGFRAVVVAAGAAAVTREDGSDPVVPAWVA